MRSRSVGLDRFCWIHLCDEQGRNQKKEHDDGKSNQIGKEDQSE